MTFKNSPNELAILGGTPAFQEPLHVGRPNIGNRAQLLDRINDLLDNRWLTNGGPYVHRFEKAVAEIVGVKHCIAMCNGTVALEIAIRALGLTGEVIVPSWTFIATVHALQWQGITPVFCDVDPRTHTIDPNCLQDLITPRTTGILGVHLWGRPCDVAALQEIARRHKVKLMFDSAHAFGCSYKGRMIGTFGAVEVLSFHATKFLNTFEGGAVVTNDDDVATRIGLMNNFGFSGYDNVISIGTNGKMSEVSGAMGITGLESMASFAAINYRNYIKYRTELDGIPGVELLRYDESEKCNYQYIVLEILETLTMVTRDQLLAVLRAENVLARRYFYPGCHRMEPYRSIFPDARSSLSQTEALAARVLVLPTGSAISTSDIALICNIIRLAIEGQKAVRSWLAEQELPSNALPGSDFS